MGCNSYTAQPPGAAISNCAWDATNTKCAENCGAAVTQSTCGANPNCEWDGYLCRLPCEQSYSTATPCTNDGRCMWDNTVSTCKTTCPQLSQSDCSADPDMSLYDDGSPTGVARCVRA
eukprot:TRINITY_DN15664_c0_g1_i1.p2 TRINITY_DN15664_c0_g1~~TRINITY_DN15664_c0_g1_i1.p2  ORF type:complete len:118 (-),score=32.57 TRINITY_DN15664_c0_g1_i1:8-361(-)